MSSKITTIGDRVKLKKNNLGGIVRFIGEIRDKTGVFYGIELDEAKGKNNGSINEISYFKCSKNKGLFVKKESILKTNSKNNENRPRVSVGDVVNVTKLKCKGAIRFIGIPYSVRDYGMFYGIELMKPKGKSNGTLNGRCYFKCKPKYAIFTQSSGFSLLNDQNHQTMTKQNQQVASKAPKIATANNSPIEPSLILSKEDPFEAKWSDHWLPHTSYIRNNAVQIESSIWYSTDYDEGEQGMVEYCLLTNKTKQVIKYKSHNIKPDRHCICKHKDKIYIIDGYKNGEIIQFDPIKTSFTKMVDMDKIGWNPSVAVIRDNIHIYNGSKNNASIAFIYFPLSNYLKKIKDEYAAKPIRNVCLLKYENQLIRFGGTESGGIRKDWFLLGNDYTPLVFGYCHKYENIFKLGDIPEVIMDMIHTYYCAEYNWSVYDLKLKQPMSGCGYIIYKHFVITFGGKAANNHQLDIDNIYILDIKNTDYGWIESPVVCPKKSRYIAVLTSDNDVHLFDNDKAGHYSLPLSMILNMDVC